MILTIIFLQSYCCLTLKTDSYPQKLFFIKNFNPSPYNTRKQRLYEYDESFNDLVDNLEDEPEQFENSNFPVKGPTRDYMDLSANCVTICGRIGHISEPFVFQNGVKTLKFSIATSERLRNGTVKTNWHKVSLYGVGNIDYIYSRARVGDRAFVMGQLNYYHPQNFDASGVSRPKLAEIQVNSSRGGNTFILMPKNPQNLENNYLNDNQQVYSDNY